MSWELERPSWAPGLRPGKQRRPITGGPGKWAAAQRESEGVVVAIAAAGQHNPPRAKGPCFIDATVEGEGRW